MTDNDIVEAYFLARGWEFMELPEYEYRVWVLPNDSRRKKLPNILESNSAFIKWVLEVMEGEGYKFIASFISVQWWSPEFEKGPYDEAIIDNNILHAAVKAATRYFEGKK